VTDFSVPDAADDAWLRNEWPTASCDCFDPATLEFAPEPCDHCTEEVTRNDPADSA
jgi:hypothetical protein